MMFVDGFLKPPYMIKSLIKLIIFGGSVIFYRIRQKETLLLFSIEKKSLIRILLLSFGIYGIIIGAYRLTANWIDYSHITETLTSTIAVKKENFLYVSIYISLINSFLEEIFFRGYCYLTLRNHMSEKISCFFSAGLFALYHGGMLDGWFSILIYLLMLGLLFLAGLFFNKLDQKSGSILPSWLPHMFANFGINTIGFILFKII